MSDIDDKIVWALKDQIVKSFIEHLAGDSTAARGEIMAALGVAAGGCAVVFGFEAAMAHFFAGIKCGMEDMARARGEKPPRFEWNNIKDGEREYDA